MYDKLVRFSDKNKNAVLPFILSVVLSSALYSVYGVGVFSVWTLLIIAVNAVFFAYCKFIDKHRIIGGVTFVLVVFIMLFLFLIMIAGNDFGMTFQQWFLTGAEKVETRTSYLIALAVSFVPFFSVVVFYFTEILYRMSFLTLISLIPCAVYVKVLSDIDDVYIAIIAILNVAVLMINARKRLEKDRVTDGGISSALAAAAFTFVLLIVSAAVPKESEARYYDRFEDLFMDNTFNQRLLSDYSLFSEFSGGADSFRNFSQVKLYTVYGIQDPYFKRQTFDYYDLENDRWYADTEYSKPYYTDFEWKTQAQKLSLAELQKAVKAADSYESGFSDKYGLSRLAQYGQIDDNIITVTIQPENFGAVYYIAPARAVSVTPSVNDEQIYVTRSGVFRNREKPHKSGMPYTVSFFDEYSARNYWFALGGADFSDEKCAEMLTELQSVLMQNNDPLYETASAFLDDYLSAMEYKQICSENNKIIPDRINALAEEITAGLTYDWEKASALQDYFSQSGYIYDLEYIPADRSVEYFLFESKRGSCSDYAAAYVLMARSLGLAVRYTEGYSPDVTSYENTFSIKDSCSHAYPEVYIQNMGWIVFEPTVASNYNSQLGDSNAGGALQIDYDLIFVLCIIAGAVLVLALLAFICAPAFSEKVFRKKLVSMPDDKCAAAAYKRLSGKVCKKLIFGGDYLTAYEFAQEFEKITGCDISAMVYVLEKCSYGNISVDDKDKQSIISVYISACEAVKKYKKSEKKKRKEMII